LTVRKGERDSVGGSIFQWEKEGGNVRKKGCGGGASGVRGKNNVQGVLFWEKSDRIVLISQGPQDGGTFVGKAWVLAF